MKLTRLTIQIWIPFAFSIVLCGMVVFASLSSIGTQMPATLPVFFCFLPMVFFFVAVAAYNQLSTLEKRIEELEGKLQKNQA